MSFKQVIAKEPEWESLSFDEAIKFFLAKLNIPTERWAEVWAEEHNRAFMVAGAMDADLLMDLRTAVEKAILDGTTLAEFRRDWDDIIEKYGWSYTGTRAWRTELVYTTNIRTAYAAGRYEQMTDPAVTTLRPFWQYRHSGVSIEPRPEHLAWDGLILPANDPWWNTHYPPNGWGCKCMVYTMSARDLKRRGKDGPDEAPPVNYYSWTDPVTKETFDVPEGIDPGWDYTPGKKDNKPELKKYPPDLRTLIKERLDI